MKDIYRWCEEYEVPFWTKFIYRKDFSVKANLWNLYSYFRFVYEMRGTHYDIDDKEQSDFSGYFLFKEKKVFESRELCSKVWQNATMLGGDKVRKEKFKIKCPERIQFGDPLYYEDFKDEPERLKKLVVDYKPKPEFKAGVLLTEMEYSEFPGYIARKMTVYFAPE